MGVKYCFRYNARNRALLDGEGPDPVNLENMPARPRRRRREKKLMTMDEVNERFPLAKYKHWVASRAREGLSTSGGVTAPPSRPASVRRLEENAVPSSPTGTKLSVDTRPNSVATGHAVTVSPTTKHPSGELDDKRKSVDVRVEEKKGLTSPSVDEHHQLEAVPTTAESIHKHPATASEEDEDEDDHIHTAVPPEFLTNPGDTCAICIDTLEDDDEVRGLTCGHAFHAGCLDPWLTGRRACCPLCKADYYVAKPRPEGEPEVTVLERERTGRRSRTTTPQPPPAAFFAVRGTRFVVPGRLGATVLRSQNAAPTAEAAAPRRWGLSNPFRDVQMPLVGLYGRDRRAAEQSATTTPSHLESVIVR